jgi:hypothetical protein
MDDSGQYPGTRPIDGHRDVIDTEIVGMTLTGGGMTLIAGAGRGAQPLSASLGNMAEQPANPSLADSFFDVFFEIDIGGGNRLYNQAPLRVTAVIDCIPPKAIYVHPNQCVPLYTSPTPGQGVHVANLTNANHTTFPGPCDPPPDCDDGNPCTQDSCDPATGTCVHTPVPDGTPCNDGNPCTQNDTCINGACVSTPVNCDDGIACTQDSCDPASGCVHTPVGCDPNHTVVRPNPCLPPPNSQYVASLQPLHQQYGTQYLLRNPKHKRFAGCTPPPPPGGSGTDNFNSEVEAEFSTDGGNTWMPIHTSGPTAVMVTSSTDSGNTRFFDTEMLSLNLQGGGLPPGVMIRESPTLASTGKTRITDQGDGTYRIGSFFDVFTELSLNNGQNWMPANGSGHMEIEEEPIACSRTIVGRRVFYNNSFYDSASTNCTNLTGASPCDDNSAVDTTKSPQLPGGGVATFANYISYSKGLNGIMVDVARTNPCVALAAVNASMFTFTMGNVTNPTAPAPAPSSVTVAPLNANTDRIKIIWPDRPFSGNSAVSINNPTWLKVLVKSAASGGIPDLAVDDVHYWGLAVGESNSVSAATPARAVVDSANDVASVTSRINNFVRVTFTDPRAPWDYDRSSLVTSIDKTVPQNNTNSFTALLLFSR